MVARADSKTMSRRGVHRQLGRDARAFHGEVHQRAVFRRTDDVVSAVNEKDWGCSFRNLQTESKFILSAAFKYPE